MTTPFRFAVGNTERRAGRRVALLPLVLLMAAPALAHPGHDGEPTSPSGLVSGLLHPLTGLDHLLAMLAVGLWAAQIGGRALWVLPATFLAVMSAGAVGALLGVRVPLVEGGIVASVVGLGVAVLCALRPPLVVAAGMTALFAVYHGAAHAAELPGGAAPAAFIVGMCATSALLHACGIGLGSALRGRSRAAAPDGAAEPDRG